jgi:S-adenosylmethionine uptake transporter
MRKAVVLAVLGVGLLAGMDAAIKIVTQTQPLMQAVFMRFAVGFLVASVIVAVTRPGLPSREAVIANGARSVLVVVTATTFFFSLSALPLAEAVALSFISPLMIALLGVLLLKEGFNARIAVTLAVGFAGMLVIVGGRLGAGGWSVHAQWGLASALFSALSYALAIVLLRARATRDPVTLIVWFQNAGAALLLVPAAVYVWQPPSLAEFALYALIGSLGAAGHLLLVQAFARAEAAALAPIEYTALVWSTLWGFVFFDEIPGLATLIGAGLIVAGTLYAQWGRETKVGPLQDPGAP